MPLSQTSVNFILYWPKSGSAVPYAVRKETAGLVGSNSLMPGYDQIVCMLTA